MTKNAAKLNFRFPGAPSNTTSEVSAANRNAGPAPSAGPLNAGEVYN